MHTRCFVKEGLYPSTPWRLLPRYFAFAVAMPPAALPAAALVVQCPARPVSASMPVSVPAGLPLVGATSFLRWAPAPAVRGGAPRASLATCVMLVAFARRCSISRALGDPARFANANLLRIGLSAAAWCRVLGELLVSGLLGCAFADLPQLRAAIDSLTIMTPANLVLHPPDLQLGEALTALPPGMNYLSLVSVVELEVDGVAPWSVIVDLAGALGHCLTRAARNAPGAHVRLAAAIISAGIRRSYSLDAGDDYALAGSLRDGVRCARLPILLLPAGADSEELFAALRDAFRYYRSDADRCAVEQSRVLFVGAERSRAPNVNAYLLSRTSDPIYAHRLLRRSAAALLESRVIDGPMEEWMSPLEERLVSQLPLLRRTANAPNATADNFVGELERDAAAIAARRSSAPPPSSLASGAASSSAPHGDAYEAALSTQPFREFAAAFAGYDISTVDGCLCGIAAGFSPKCILTVRVLCYGERTIARRHEQLGRLLEARPHLYSHFTLHLMADVETGEVPSYRREWSITGADGSDTLFLEQFLRQDIHLMAWAHMACKWQHALTGSANSSPLECPPDADHFCVPSFIRVIIDLGERLFGAMGLPALLPLPQGFTWRTWWVFYIDHVNFVSRLPSRERMLDWLDDAHLQALAALRLMSTTLKALLTCSAPGSRALGALLPTDCQPARILREKRKELSELFGSGLLDALLHDQSDGTVAVDDGRAYWPRRSERHGTTSRTAPVPHSSSAAADKPAVERRQHKRPRWPPADAHRRRVNHGFLKAIRKMHPPIKGRGPCYFHFQPGESCPDGTSCKYHHGN